MERERITLTGESGETYPFVVFNLVDDFPDAPGVYVFAELSEKSGEALYIDSAANLAKRMQSPTTKHNRAERKGATHILMRYNRQRSKRRDEVDDLTAFYDPPV